MDSKFILAAQLQTYPSFREDEETKRVLDHVRRASEAGGLDLLAIGGEEIQALFESLTARDTRRTEQVYLWYPILADNRALQTSQTAINYRGNPLQGLTNAEAQESIDEKFQFACPNHPGVKADILEHLDTLLRRYDFDGVFLDKIRFPSPANGLDEMFSCFCAHCRRAAAEYDLDLEQVRATFLRPLGSAGAGMPGRRVLPSGAVWLEALLKDQPLIQQFLAFRAGSITHLVGEIGSLMRQLGRQLSLDLFSPGLAALVGQDYRALAAHADWCKPMIYRYAKGPAGLRTEIPNLIHELARFMDVPSSVDSNRPRDRLLWHHA